MNEPPPEIPDHRLLRVIGRGAYGVVWLAESLFGIRRAVKIVRRGGTSDPRAFDREQAGIRQFETLSREHPGLVDVLQVGLTADTGDFYYVMEAADGAEAGPGEASYVPLSLRWELDRLGRMEARRSLLIALEIAGTLGFLHSRGVVHRDVKPSNILFVDGRAKLADGGLMALTGEAQTEVGTRGYAPAEGIGTPAADCYALGRVLHELATGGDRALHELPSELANAANRAEFLELQEVVFRACDPEPTRRYESGIAMERDLRRVLAGESLRRVRQFENRARRFRRAATAGAVAVVALAAAWALEARHGRALARLEQESRTHLVRLCLSNGRRALADGYWSLAALWFTRALPLAQDPGESEALRWRIGAIRSLAPGLEAVGAHENAVNEVSFSPDGSMFASASEDGTVQLLAVSELPARTIPGTASAPPAEPVLLATLRHDGPVNDVGFGRDGRVVVTASSDGTVGLWDTRTGGIVHRLRHGGHVTRATISPDGRRIAAAADDGRVLVWETGSGALALPELRHSAAVQWVEFSPDGRWLLTAANDREARVWNVADGQLRFPPLGHPSAIAFATYSPDGSRILTAGDDGAARFWNATNGVPQPGTIQQGALNYAGFSHGGRWVLTASGRSIDAGEVQVWDARSLEPAGPSIRHANRVRFAAFSPDDLWVVTVGHDGLAQLRRTGAGGESIRLQHDGRVWAAGFSPDGRRLVTGGSGRLWRLWNLAGAGSSPFRLPWTSEQGSFARWSVDGRWLMASPKPRSATRSWRLDTQGRPLERFDLPKYRISSAVAPDGRSVAVSNPNGNVAVWDPDGSRITRGPFPHAAGSGRLAVFSPDGRTMYTAALSDDSVNAWNLDTGEVRWPPVRLPVADHVDLAASPDGTRLAVVCGDHLGSRGAWALIDTTSGTPVVPIQSVAAACNRAAFSPDGRWLAVGNETSGVRPTEVLLLDPRTGASSSARLRVSDGVSNLRFSPDGRQLAVATSDYRVLVCSVPDFGPTISLALDQGIQTLSFSPDNRRLMTGQANGAVVIWDVHSGERLVDLPRQQGGICTAEFAGDGNWVLVSGVDPDVRLVRLGPVLPGGTAQLKADLELDAGAEISEDGSTTLFTAETLLDRWKNRRRPRDNRPLPRSD